MFPVYRHDTGTGHFCLESCQSPSQELVEPVEKDFTSTLSANMCTCAHLDSQKLPLATKEDADDDGESTADGTCSDEHTSVCGVCLLDFEHGDECRSFKCGHSFHRECIDNWLLNSSTVCPIDKRDVRQ